MVEKQKKQKKPRKPWDMYRRIAVWLGLLMPIAVLSYWFVVGRPMFTGASTPAGTDLTVIFLAGPAVLSGAVTGSRFLALYAGLVEHADPTEPLPRQDGTKAYAAAVSGPTGDWLWSGLVAGVLGGLVITAFVAPGYSDGDGALGAFLFGALVYLPIVFTAIIAWALGAICGTLVSVFLSAAVGILIGLKHRPQRGATATWLLIAAFLVLLLVGIFGMLGVTGVAEPSGFVYLAGLPVPGARFRFGGALLDVTRVAIDASAVIFLLLVGIGTPHLLRRLRSPEATA